MKKLLILALVLCVTGVASASSMSLVVAGALPGNELLADTAYVGQIVWTSTGTDTSFRTAISISGATSYGTGLVVAKARTGLFSDGILYNPSVSGIAIGKVEGYTNVAGPFLLTGDVVYDFAFTTGAVGTTVALDDVAIGGVPPWGGAPIGYDSKINGIATDMDSATFTVVPEPATMLLLGLGGLLIRRKK